MLNEEQLKKLHHSSMFNKMKIESQKQLCGCFCCEETFKAQDIKEWTDRSRTALCPYCGIDSVLPNTKEFPITNELLNQMNNRWFGLLNEKDFDFIPHKS